MSKVPLRRFDTATNTYESCGIIGEGANGKVYAVSDRDANNFALKLLSGTSNEKEKRFKNELSFCRRNEHDRIVRVLDEGVAITVSRREPFYVMPLYKSSLRALMKEGLQDKEVLGLFLDMLDGVEAAHIQGIIHRDLKPENFLVDQSRRVVVADFGIAHFEEDQLATFIETKDGDRLANFQYAAPEQKTRDGTVDRRADIFALGLILNELFTEHIPQGANFATIASTASSFAYLDPIVEKMIQQHPKDRPSSIAAVKQEMELRGKEFIAYQEYDAARKRVVPAASANDPLGGY
jgi:serine/threonine protein kinase